MTESLGWTAGAFFLSGLPPAQEGRLLRAGSGLLLTGLVALAWFMPHGPLWLIVAAAFFGTAGFGMMWGYVIRLVVAHAAPGDRDRPDRCCPAPSRPASRSAPR